MISAPSKDDLLTRLNDELSRQYGSVLGSADLVKVLGYPSAGAFRMAMVRGTVPVPLFTIPHRRGHFALTLEVAAWMCSQRFESCASHRLGPEQGGGVSQEVNGHPAAEGCIES